MSELSKMMCEACRPDAPHATEEQIAHYQPQIPEWDIVHEDGVKKLRRRYPFKNFADALAFTNQVGAMAEEVGHHPDILTEWGGATVTWWSHKIKGLHVNDFIMAGRCDGAYVPS